MQSVKQLRIIEKIKNKNKLIKIAVFVIGTFISALSYNLFFVPNNYVTGGVSGLAIIFNNLTGISVSKVVFFGNLMCVGLGYIFLGGKTSYSAVGAGLYTLFVMLTENVSSAINFSFDNELLYVLAAGITNGIGEALVYRLGYSTGGTSIIALILVKKLKVQLGKISRIMSFIVMALGGFIFGYTMIMYALIIVVISTFIIDKITLGISDSKMFYIQTSKIDGVSSFIMEVLGSGITEFNIKGVYSGKSQKMLMCVVPTEKYVNLKSAIKEIDPEAFIVVSDCYEVLGGTKKNILPI